MESGVQSVRIKARHHLREDATKKVLDTMRASFGEDIEAAFAGKTLEIAETDEAQEFILVNGQPWLFSVESSGFFPTVRGAMFLKPKKKLITVDMGAIKFITKGADIMSPGIVDVDNGIRKGDLVVILDEVHHKPLAVGRALVNADAMMGNRGKAVKSIHYVGDRIWNLEL